MEETSQTPPASAGGEAETLVAAKEEDAAAAKEKDKAKRARKRSRYLSPPYTDSDAGADISPRREEQDQDERGDEEVSLLLQLQEAKLAAADMLSALHGTALFDASPNRAHANANVVDVDVLLRFFTLYRSKVLLLPDDHHSSNANAAGLGINNKKKPSSSSTININKDDDDSPLSSSLVGHKLLNAVRAMADADGSACRNVIAIKKEDDAMENAHHIGAVNAAAALEAGHRRKKMASAYNGLNATTDFAVQATNGIADYAPSKKKTRKRKAGHGQHFGSPAALVLDFTRGTALPSKEELLSSFRKFGFLIESETDIAQDTRRARVVFGTSAEAEAAYSCAETLGAFGPPFAARRLQYLSPIKLNAPQPPPSPSHAPKLPLTDIRKNLEKMISSLTRPSSFRKDDGAKPAVHNLVGEMQGLLAKVDKMLSAGPSSSTTALHHH